MQLIIKSFNRPFYLDRCLRSIEKFVSGQFQILILDDGTPDKYLAKIKKDHPHATILTSENYRTKTAAIAENIQSGKEIDGFQIPAKLWYNAVDDAEDYVLVTEDDVWFTQPVNLSEIKKDMANHHISLLKLGWLGNKGEEEHVKMSPITNQIDRLRPKKLFTGRKWVMDCLMYNRFKIFSVLYKLGFVDNNTRNSYWSLNSIAMGIYDKEYWLHIWKDSQDKVDEKAQLRNAAVYYHKNKSNPNFIARTATEFLKTTFQSSATNSYHKYDIAFDVNFFNHLINEAWLLGTFDAMQNFPNDFTTEYFSKFIEDKMNVSDFEKWVEKFKDQYRNLGAMVDN